jgi:hypothetical protein
VITGGLVPRLQKLDFERRALWIVPQHTTSRFAGRNARQSPIAPHCREVVRRQSRHVPTHTRRRKYQAQSRERSSIRVSSSAGENTVCDVKVRRHLINYFICCLDFSADIVPRLAADTGAIAVFAGRGLRLRRPLSGRGGIRRRADHGVAQKCPSSGHR